jgi:hypothetical protein
MAERLKATVLKIVEPKGSVSSNLTLPASLERSGGRAVEGTALLTRRTLTGTESSNLSRSAIFVTGPRNSNWKSSWLLTSELGVRVSPGAPVLGSSFNGRTLRSQRKDAGSTPTDPTKVSKSLALWCSGSIVLFQGTDVGPIPTSVTSGGYSVEEARKVVALVAWVRTPLATPQD